MVIELVTMAEPCSQCLIIDDLMRDLLQKTVPDIAGADLKIVALRHPRECANVEGLEVEKLPAVIIDGEQVTAGSLLHRRQLLQLIESRARGAE